MVSVMVIETGLPETAGRNQYSERWENSLMDAFFEAGQIVSNAPIMRLVSKPSAGIEAIAEPEFEEAVEGGFDYFIIVHLDFTSGSQSPGTISLLLFRLTPHSKLLERNIQGRSFSSAREESDFFRTTIAGLMPYITN
jgi:hypothetical protein